jgi:RNA polymerase sigma-70 factor (ECF subfamily)
MHTTSLTLLQRLRNQSDEEAWLLFVNLYTPLLRRWASQIGLPAVDSDDLVQEILLIALAKLPSFTYSHDGSFKAWLRKTAENKSIEFFRRRKVVGRGTGDAGLSGVSVPADASRFWDHEFNQHLAARALELMQREFHETTWKACWELTFNNRPAAEVGPELGISPNACYVAKGRVLRRMRELLGELGEF